MASGLSSQPENAQFKGPLTSDSYNKRIEALYFDLLYEYTKAGVIEEAVMRSYQRLLKQCYSLSNAIHDLEVRIDGLENVNPTLVFTTSEHDDTTRFVGTTYEIQGTDKLTIDTQYGVMTLPKVEISSISKVTFQDNQGQIVVPSTLDVRIAPEQTSADNVSAVVDSSAIENAFLNQVGAIWERNVVVTNPNPNAAIMNMYIRIPNELSTTATANNIRLNPFPAFGCDILGVYYTTKFDIALNDGDNYVPVNDSGAYANNSDSVGWIAPGSWDGDEINGSGPRSFYFDPQSVTAVKIVLRQPNYYVDSGRFVYTYGMTSLDIRDDKFISTGKVLLRFDVPDGKTISTVHSVTPQVWNVDEVEVENVFDYRIIWETSFNSGVYSLTPVPLSKRVWIEVTLSTTGGDGTPALSGLVVNYS